MANTRLHSTCHLLELPRELRDQIYGEVFFPGEQQPEEQDWWGLARTAVRQIHPYDFDRRHLLRFDFALMRTCHQIQMEAEAVFYGTSSFNLMYQDWDGMDKLSYEFLEKLPARNRRLIRRIERKCYSEPYSQTISLCDWKLFMTFLARECPNLQSLKLWGPGDRQEGPLWVKTCQKEKEWVQAILQIRGLSYFDIPVIKGGVIYDYQSFRDDFLPWLKTSLLQNTRRHHDPPLFPQARPVPCFPFLRLPSCVRRRVYEVLLLPPNKRLHPYLKPWYDQTTHNLVPLLRTCRFIQNEAEKVLYEGAIFTSLIRKYDHGLLNFVRNSLPDRLRDLIRSVRIEDGDYPHSALIAYLALRMQVETLTLVLSATKVDRVNVEWEQGADRRPRTEWDETFLDLCARFRTFRVETSDPSSILNPACRAWLETRSGAEMKDPTPVEYAWLPYDSDDGFHSYDPDDDDLFD